MLHHLGLIAAIGVAGAAFFLPPSCNPLSKSAPNAAQKPAAVAVQAPVPAQAAPDFDGSAIIADQARRYVAALYSTDPGQVQEVLAVHAGNIGVASSQVQAAVADNRVRSPVKDVVIVRQEIENIPPKGQGGSVWFAILRTDGTTQTGRLSGWRRHADNWRFTLASY